MLKIYILLISLFLFLTGCSNNGSTEKDENMKKAEKTHENIKKEEQKNENELTKDKEKKYD